MTGSPSSTAKPLLGNIAVNEYALALIRWHPRQWQAIVKIGAAVARMRTCPQRHPPFQDKDWSIGKSFSWSSPADFRQYIRRESRRSRQTAVGQVYALVSQFSPGNPSDRKREDNQAPVGPFRPFVSMICMSESRRSRQSERMPRYLTRAGDVDQQDRFNPRYDLE